MKTIAFVGVNELLVDFVNEISKENRVIVFDSFFSDRLEKDVIKVHLKKHFFGLEKILSFFNLETSLPFYLKNLSSKLHTYSPDKIIVMDFFRLWYIQSLSYAKKHQGSELYVYSETQRFPRNIITRSIFILFLFFFKLNKKYVKKYLAYTKQGIDFAARVISGVKIACTPVPVREDIFNGKHSEYKQNGKLNILVNARFVEYKNYDVIISALGKIANKVDFSATFVGRSNTGTDKILSLIQASGLQDKIRVTPPVSLEDIALLYKNSDILLLVSTYEAIGLVVLEAMFSGLPTITSDTVGANVYVKDGETGLIVKTRDADDLAKAIMALDDKNKLLSFGNEANLIANSEFSREKLVNHFLTEVGL